MIEKPPEQKEEFSERLKQLWAPIAIVVGVITMVYAYFQLWDVTTTLLLAGGGFIVTLIALIWIGFSSRTIKLPVTETIGETTTEKNPLFALRYRRAAKILLILIIPLAISVIFMHESASSYYNRGTSHQSQSEYQLAIQDFDRAIELDPNYEEAFYNRGKAYYHLGEYQRAIQDFSRVIELDLQYTLPYNKRGKCYQALGMTAEAEADFARYKELTGKDQP